MLRFRRVVQAGETVCQAMLQSVATKETKYFRDVHELTVYLNTQADRLCQADQDVDSLDANSHLAEAAS